MNATSSRAHTIVTVTIVQKYKNDAGKEMAKTSIINLVDLAGSERADQVCKHDKSMLWLSNNLNT